MEEITLMLVDDHEVVRTGLRSFLQNQEGLKVIAEANDGKSALEIALKLKPDVIIMDISMPGMNGLQATRRIKEAWSESKVLALTVHEDKDYFFEMLAAGANGYVTKQAAAEDLVSAIKAVSSGNVFLQPALARWLLDDYNRILTHSEIPSRRSEDEDTSHPDLNILSKRELQVLELVARGNTNNETGEELGISPKTVARHRERIMAKLNLHSCAELVRFAIKTGVIPL